MTWVPEIVGVGAAVAGLSGVWQRSQWCTSQIWGRTLVHGPQPRELALTFDDGPNDRYTQEILEKLASANVRATFFMVGAYARQLPWLVRHVAEAGHVVGNHSMFHSNLLWKNAKAMEAELRDCSSVLEDMTGQPVRFFRPPYGKRRPAVLRIARELGMETVMWNSMGFDWRSSQVPKQIMKSVERDIRSNRKAGHGSTILLHDGGPNSINAERSRTVAALGSLLARGPAAHYRFVPITEWWPPGVPLQ